MQDELTAEDVAPLGARTHVDSCAVHSSELDDDGKPELRGALPPDAPDATPREVDEPASNGTKTDLRGFSNWGPWRRWKLYSDFGRLERDDSNCWRKSDSEKNARGRLPNTESIEVPAVWVAELYTPSTVGGLLDGISKLGWEYGRSRDDSLCKWMNDVREGRRAGSTSLGLVSPLDGDLLMRERSAPMPEGVRAALPILVSLTPSITALVIAFIFQEDDAASLQKALREEYQTTFCRNPKLSLWQVFRFVITNAETRIGHSIYDPDIARRREVKKGVRVLERRCTSWVRECLPGAFSTIDGASIPTAALFVTEVVRPMSEEARSIRALDGLAIGRDYDAWESAEWPGARLVLPRGWDDEENRLDFACRRRDAFPEHSGYSDPTSGWTISQRAHDLVPGLLSRWALMCLLDCYHRALSGLRDQTALNSQYRPVRDLKGLRSLARTTLYDIDACTQEISQYAESDTDFKFDVLEMVYVREVGGKRPDLVNGLQATLVARAQQVKRDAGLLKSTLSTSSDISQAISNIRIQRLVVWLTLISLGIATWAAYTSLQAAA